MKHPLPPTRRCTTACWGVLWLLLAFGVAPVVSAVASDQSRARSGQEIVQAVCVECHSSGVNGAPKIGDRRAWSQLAAQSLTSLTGAALKGVRRMPPHGGNPGLTDIEIERAITYMVNQSGGDWVEPVSRLDAVSERPGAEVAQAYCAKCHQDGSAGAPRIGDRTAWVVRVKPGFELLVRSAINGHGSMPSRGDAAGLTDAEIRSALAYMVNPEGVNQTGPALPAASAPGRDRHGTQGAEKNPVALRWLQTLWLRIGGH